MLGVAIFFLLTKECGDCAPGSTTTTTTVTPRHSRLVPELLGSETTADHLGLLPLLSLMVFLAAFFLGLGPIPFNWLVSWLVAQSTPPLSDSIGPSACYFIFSAIALLGTVFISLCMPETKGKSEEEIRSIFSNDVQYVDLD